MMQGRVLERRKTSNSFHLWEYPMSFRHRSNPELYVHINSFNCVAEKENLLKIMPILSIVEIWLYKNVFLLLWKDCYDKNVRPLLCQSDRSAFTCVL